MADEKRLLEESVRRMRRAVRAAEETAEEIEDERFRALKEETAPPVRTEERLP